jgi:hypothetical protein
LKSSEAENRVTELRVTEKQTGTPGKKKGSYWLE